jgi:hypothetical protein
MRITPSKGLLELNSRSDKRSKKERHAMVRSASSFSSIHARIYNHDLHLKRNKECVRSSTKMLIANDSSPYDDFADRCLNSSGGATNNNLMS